MANFINTFRTLDAIATYYGQSRQCLDDIGYSILAHKIENVILLAFDLNYYLT